jgi:hypothetical protein
MEAAGLGGAALELELTRGALRFDEGSGAAQRAGTGPAG